MEKIDSRTPDLTGENVERLLELFPDAATESVDADGNLLRSVDFDVLRGDLSGSVAEGQRERYQFTWPGKAAAKLEARRPTTKTMRPCPERSVDWDTTQNLYIEGDNLEALKIMRETYQGRVKLIYIDPPYNTGHDFIYDDDYSTTRAEYEAASGDWDDDGGRLVANPESNGRFHSDWCSMMYPRLLLARDLLSDDGAIFISIDDGEAANLEKMMDEIMGRTSYVARFEVINNLKGRNDRRNYAPCHEHLVVYSKDSFCSRGIPLSEEKESEFDHTDENGEKYQLRDLRKRGNGDRREDRPNMYYPIFFNADSGLCTLEESDDLVKVLPIKGDGADGRWRWGSETVASHLDYLSPKKKRNGTWGMDYRVYLNPSLNPKSNSDEEERREKPKSFWSGPEFSTDVAQRELKALFDEKPPFDFPKATAIIERAIQMTCSDGDTVLDFFSGSATTAQAVFQVCAHEGTRLNFVLVQLQEDLDENLARASREGRETIENAIALCDKLCVEHELTNVGEERIRRAGAKITAEVGESNRQLELGQEPRQAPDVGFRVLRVGDSCLRDTYAAPSATGQATLDELVDNLGDGADPLDLLFQVLPAFRIPYSAPYEELEVGGMRVFDVDGGRLLACFDEGVSTGAIEAIARMRPLYAVFRDASFRDDSAVANLEELFRTFSPDTVLRVI